MRLPVFKPVFLFDKISIRNYNEFCTLTHFYAIRKRLNNLKKERPFTLPMPANKVDFGNQPLSPDLMDSLFKMIRGKKKPFLGFLRAKSDAKQHILFILESDPYAAVVFEEETARAQTVRDFFI